MCSIGGSKFIFYTLIHDIKDRLYLRMNLRMNSIIRRSSIISRQWTFSRHFLFTYLTYSEKSSWPYHPKFWNYGHFWLVAPSKRRLYGLNTFLVANTCNSCKIWTISDIPLINFVRILVLIELLHSYKILFTYLLFSLSFYCPPLFGNDKTIECQ